MAKKQTKRLIHPGVCFFQRPQKPPVALLLQVLPQQALQKPCRQPLIR